MKISCDRIPLATKLAITAFLVVLIPAYWNTCGPANFLRFCDTALLLTVAGIWLESPLLISMCAVGILLPQCLWLADFGGKLFGLHLLSPAPYSFAPGTVWLTWGRSLFHGLLPLLLVWLLFRLGYDGRALRAWSGLAAVLLLASYFFTLPAGAHPADPNTPVNLNYIYGFNDRRPQAWINQNLYVILWFGVLWLTAFLPTHLVLRNIFAVRSPATRRRLPVQLQ